MVAASLDTTASPVSPHELPLRVLVVEDSPDDAELVALELRRGGYAPSYHRVQTSDDMEAAIEGEPWDLIVSDFSMPEFTAPEALEVAQRLIPEVPFIVVSGTVGEETAVECMRAGARDFLSKMNLARLSGAVARELADARARRSRERELERLVQDLRRSNEELEQFAYVASHDLQEPLRMVTSYMELLAADYADQLDARADKYITYAVQGARRLKALIDALLSYSRVNSRGAPAEKCATTEVVEAVLQDLAVAVAESAASVSYGVLPSVIVDRTQFEQVFRNLISNAIKFRGSAPPRIVISAERAGSRWRFSVKDNGIGIEPQHRSRIFEMFQRLHERDKYDGSGVGLAMTKRIIERHAGRIWVEGNAEEPGSRFLFELPEPVREDVEAHEP